ncbi:CPBP family intramembrane glutamic endopeptidase [Pseudoduganella chitinolytica]|uniref:Type II CAAX endopeptidase family protein n=1 Tax=Pseudoduganella chitinolytica TaxID=34070 RepID=A0ABY8B4F2_9BURK|nr:type II CAAX endopeptidase family protein [Pseudoduganella chitinolytica]WEF30825.1 type II CAAX endopeptidase family protein [Pseudoduganella chitinolytica]
MTTSPTVPSRARPPRRLLAHPLVRAILAVLCMLVPFFGLLVLAEAVPKPYRTAWPMLLATLGMLAGYRFYVRRFEQRDVAELGLAGAGDELGRGLGMGALLVVFCSAVLLAAGAWTATGTAHWTVILVPLPEQVMVAFMEEILFRAVIFRLLERSWGTTIALVVSSVLFVLAHVPNDSFSVFAAVMTAVASVTLTGAWLMTRRLWLPVGLHFAWNYLFDAVFSLPVSGNPGRGWIQVTTSGPAWLTGGTYGVEGSFVTLIGWGVAALLLLAAARRRGHWLPKPQV